MWLDCFPLPVLQYLAFQGPVLLFVLLASFQSTPSFTLSLERQQPLEHFRFKWIQERIAKCGFTSTPVHQKQVYRGPRLNGKPALSSVTLVYTYRRTALTFAKRHVRFSRD